MSGLLTDPTAVLVAGGGNDSRAGLRETLREVDGISDVVTRDRLTDVEDVLAERDDVGCVVGLATEAATVSTVWEGVQEWDENLPLVVSAPLDPAVGSAVAERAGCRLLPQSADEAVVRGTVANAVSTYDRRRRQAADSSILETLLAEGDLSLFAKDAQGRYLRMADVPYTPDPEEARGKTDPEIFEGYDRDVPREAYEDDLRVVETGEAIREKIERYEGRGGEHWSETTKVPWYDADGDVRGLVGYAIDVTDREQCHQRLEELRERFDQFASYVSHDLRTPLQVTVGALAQARAGEDEALDRIERATDRIEEIIDDLSALSKGDRTVSGLSADALAALDIGVESTDLAALIENVWEIDSTADATLETDLPAGTAVVTEAETLRPLVENLLRNAVDHAGPDVTVRVGTIERGFYVADDGPGIPPAERERVLEEGYTTAEDGSGTGLSIVSETVDRQDWGLTITESDAGGARFEITDCPVVVPHGATPGDAIDFSANRDIGDVSVAGEATYDPDRDVWTVVGDGRDIWQEIDEFHFVHGSADGPVRIEGRLSDFEGVHEYSKAGLMVRSGLAEGDACAFVGATEAHGTETLWRTQSGGDARSEQLEEPYEAYTYYRLDAVDGDVTLSFSTDGEEWQPLNQLPIDLGESVPIGLAVCSHDGDETVEAHFEDVSIHELVR